MKKRTMTVAIIVVMLVSLAIPGLAASGYTKQATLNYNDIKITLNGTAITPKDANGNTVEPFIIDGTTYLPVRAVADALGIQVEWDGSTNTVKLSGSAAAAMPTAPFTLSAGQYVVGDDIPAGKYDCKAVSGSGNFQGTVAALGYMGLNEILGAPGTSFAECPSYSNLRLANGDVITISQDLNVEFTAK